MDYLFRLRNIVIGNFGSIGKGKINIPDNSSDEAVFRSEIIGIYGQNGTGKSTVLTAIEILNSLFDSYEREKDINVEMFSRIRAGKSSSKLEFSFDIFSRSVSGKIGTLYYCFTLRTATKGQCGLYGLTQETLTINIDGHDSIELHIGNRTPLEDIATVARIVTGSSDSLFFSEVRNLLVEARNQAAVKGKSIFSRFFVCALHNVDSDSSCTDVDVSSMLDRLNTMNSTSCNIFNLTYSFCNYIDESIWLTDHDLFNLRNNDTIEYYQPCRCRNSEGEILYDYYKVSMKDSSRCLDEKFLEAVNRHGDIYGNIFGKDFLREFEDGIMNDDFTGHNAVVFSDYEPLSIETVHKSFEQHVRMMSKVIESIFPDIKLKLEENDEFYLYAEHEDGTRIPLNKESYGVKKIYMLVKSLRQLFNDPNSLVIIDEFDEGLFEYTFGEILSAIRDNAVGQLIFSAHNLRALENLDKNSICFSTSDPDNRFVTMKNVKPTNNLRDLYIRRMYLSEGGQDLYSGSSSSAMAFALENMRNEQYE